MTDYISREAALNFETKITWTAPSEIQAISQGMALYAKHIADIPAADVVPVVHGRWDTTDAFPHHVYCTACNMTYIPNDRWQVWQDKYGEGGLPRAYCPNCGAKMDGGETDA